MISVEIKRPTEKIAEYVKVGNLFKTDSGDVFIRGSDCVFCVKNVSGKVILFKSYARLNTAVSNGVDFNLKVVEETGPLEVQ